MRWTCPRERDLLALFASSAGEYLDGWFESDPIKAVYGFDGIVGNYASPYTPGSALCAAASRVRRGERQARAPGATPSAAWARSPRPWPGRPVPQGVDIRVDSAGARGDRREGARGRRGLREWRGLPRAPRRRPTSIRNCCYERLVDPALVPADFRERIGALALRLGHVPDECGAVARCRASPACRARRSSDRRHHHGAQPGLYGPGLSATPARLAGRRSRSWRC